ncbi:PREDICTED: RNA pseudouridylate synthase domain-containing protein 1-like [Nicrophorus vespilloides]|uniref:RNA pseudouridylate synthase domain-containing protein 1-like n=1 Tax=Nicrophorus vespilloides TaxID=110193 RepID=A0ABM1N0A2_NICVS|nr:PREDICTED: RNA pseudouridylate synthase domain-containing protein 1-like [Nicrophorus vespilloides]
MIVVVLKAFELLFKFLRENRPEIIYFSKNYLLVNKPYDLLINSNNKNQYTIQTYLRRKVPEHINNKLYHDFYFVHRLDYATSGILCIPLNKNACKITFSLFQLRQIRKYYLAIVRGVISQELLFINLAIGENCIDTAAQKMCTNDRSYCVKAKDAMTVLLVLETGLYDSYPCTKVLVKPITGRRHQIRVHCSALGHTIVGDYTYSNKKDTKPHRMFLHSHRLKLPNVEEDIDVQTKDPFRGLKNWIRLESINELDDGAYNKIDEFVKY